VKNSGGGDGKREAQDGRLETVGYALENGQGDATFLSASH
jgi:hypothetical protein